MRSSLTVFGLLLLAGVGGVGAITAPNTSLATVPTGYFGGNYLRRDAASIEMLCVSSIALASCYLYSGLSNHPHVAQLLSFQPLQHCPCFVLPFLRPLQQPACSTAPPLSNLSSIALASCYLFFGLSNNPHVAQLLSFPPLTCTPRTPRTHAVQRCE